jgi:hypothetical protein
MLTCIKIDRLKDYIKNDLNSLYEIISKFNKQIFFDYKINITESATISRLAMKIFLTKHYKNNILNINKTNILNINKNNIYKDIKQAYYRGITEVYIPYGENLYYYDVNSLYLYMVLQDMPGLEYSKIEFFVNKQDLDNLFGFFYCIVKSPTYS